MVESLDFDAVSVFEHEIAKFYGAPYAVATDCCTHAIELCLRYTNANQIGCPTNTYIGIPMVLNKLGVDWNFIDIRWEDYYNLQGTNIIDAAVFWRSNGYIKNSFMCLSFQYKKHLNLIRGGAILTDDVGAYQILKKMSYDGRNPGIPWKEQNIDTWGYHYYMTPETALLGLEKLPEAMQSSPKKINYRDYPYLPDMQIFHG